MPSTLFEARIEPDRTLHRVLCWGAVVALVTGVALVQIVDQPLLRGAGTLLWVLYCGRELARFAQFGLRVQGIVLDSAGQAALVGADSARKPARLLPGTVITRNLAWLRLADEAGIAYTGLHLGGRSDAAQWHRLQLLWEQSRTAFGHPARA